MLTVNICSHMKGKFIFLENLNNLNPAGFVFDILKGNKKNNFIVSTNPGFRANCLTVKILSRMSEVEKYFFLLIFL